VRFTLNGFELSAEAQVRFVNAPRSSRLRDAPRTLGLRFINMHSAFEQRIQAYVQRRDRELLRDTGKMFE
jgi:c-di-GMP-binding flagellar brake protein YcgR